jgi:DNA-binding GntR family transcriptional regulator
MLIAQTTADVIAAELREEILRGEIPPGAALRQEALAARFSVSRIPVREALRALERDGLVEVHPNRGAFVIRLTAAAIVENTELRMLIEGDLVERSVRSMSDADIEAVAAAAAAAAAAARTPKWSEADRQFHQTLYLPAGRPQQLALVLALRRAVERYWAIYRRLPARTDEWMEDHRALADACRARDPLAAKRVLVDHVARAGAFLVHRLETEGS